MNIRVLSIVIFFVGIQVLRTANAQATFQFGGLPALNINKKFENNWSLNTKVESRQRFKGGTFQGALDNTYKYVLTDVSLIAARKVGLNARVAGGYLIRVEGSNLFHRFIQQYSFVNRMIGFRLAHRFLSDQTLSQIEDPEFRLRYRVVSEIPLNGESVDPKELYLKLGNEYINSLQSSQYDLEVRFLPMIGYGVTKTFRIETGLDYRVRSFLNDSARHSFWMSINFFLDM